jgi:Ca-activated chloride channel family protein
MAFTSTFILYLLIILVPVLIFAEYYSEKHRREFLNSLFSRENAEKLLTGYNIRLIELKKVMKTLGLLFLIFALAGPRFGAKMMTVKKQGVDVIIAVDVSRSMLAPDIQPSRLEKAKQELQLLIDKLSGNRIGIIAFAGKPFLQCPLTMDTAACKIFMDSLTTDLIPVPGTAIGDAIDLAVKNFVKEERKYKALILLTDGEDHETDPLSAAASAGKEGVRIYTIGFGTAQGDLIPEKDDATGAVTGYRKDKKGNTVMTKLDEQTLQKIADSTDGKYYRATDGEIEVSRIAEDISGMETRQISSKKYERFEEKFYYFLFIGLVLILVETFLPDGMGANTEI